jgi:hypothetical protein
MRLSGDELVAMLVSVSFAAGLNVYATVATLGLLAHTGWVTMPGSLQVLGNWWVIGVSGVMFALEFVADKIPAFDLALLAWRATAQLSPWEQALAAAAGGAIALAAHGGKTAARAAVTPSPEPFSNAALSFGEDGIAVFLTWLSTKHPYAAAGIVVGLLITIALLMRWVWKALKSLFHRTEQAVAG